MSQFSNSIAFQLSPSTKASNPFASKDVTTLVSLNKEKKKKKTYSLKDLKQILREERATSEQTASNDNHTIETLIRKAPGGNPTGYISQSPRRSSLNGTNRISPNSTVQISSPLKNTMSSSFSNLSRSQILESPSRKSILKRSDSLSPTTDGLAGKSQKTILTSIQTGIAHSPKTPHSPMTPSGKDAGDAFVEEIVALEREMKLRSSGRKKLTPGSRLGTPLTPRSPGTPTSKLSQSIIEEEPLSPRSPSTPSKDILQETWPKKPVLFNSVDNQQPLKLQYDPRQIRFGASDIGDKSLKDLQIMAEACNRAGKHRMEALAHYKIATMYEDAQKPAQSINHYRKFLQICQGLKDEIGTSLALNRLGVMFQSLGGDENYKTALEYHIRHWEIADTQSRIVAHINMGLVFQYGSQDYENAGEHYRMAFQYALEIGDKQGESIALSNLGTLGKDSGDLLTAQACIERHLALSESMKDGKSTTDAYQQLGHLANERGNTENAVKMLSKARQIATIQNDQVKANQIKCSIGIIEGNAKFEAYIKNLSEKLTTKSNNIIIPPNFNVSQDTEY